MIIGLTGSIGMGKSTAAKMLRDLGIPVHCADEAVHKSMAIGGAAVEPLSLVFPDALVKNAQGQNYIDRSILSKYVLGQPENLKKLEAIVHPLVRQDSDAFEKKMLQQGHKIIVLDIPLLFETGRYKDVDTIFVVSAPYDVQEKRVLKRPNMTAEKFQHILKQQTPDAEKRSKADVIIDSSQSLEKMRRQISTVVQQLKKKLSPKPPKR